MYLYLPEHCTQYRNLSTVPGPSLCGSTYGRCGLKAGLAFLDFGPCSCACLLEGIISMLLELGIPSTYIWSVHQLTRQPNWYLTW